MPRGVTVTFIAMLGHLTHPGTSVGLWIKYVDEILSETLENKIEPLIDIKSEIGQKIKNDQIEPSTQTH